MERLVCRDCGEKFTWTPEKPGYRNQCEGCAQDVELVGGNMVEGELELKTRAQAERFEQLKISAAPRSLVRLLKTSATRRKVDIVAGYEPE